MPQKHEIESKKILVKDIFSTLWFCIPEYQRPYIWGSDEIDDLLDDLKFAHAEKPDQEYFLGSFVFQNRKRNAHQEFDENDLLDGQQRMTTLLMIFSCIRDISDDSEVKAACSEAVFQKGSSIKRIPERTRIKFAIREAVERFVDEYVKPVGGTNKTVELKRLREKSPDRSVRNMAAAILQIRHVLTGADEQNPLELGRFVGFILNQVLLIYVATEDLDDAFRLFTILNDRGVPLRNSDILKSTNLGALENPADKQRYAKMWEEAEGELGDDFDRFLSHIRTILVKDKARLNLLDEYEHKIYHPREKDKTTGKQKPALLKKGRETFELVKRYLQHYDQVFGGNNYDETGQSFEFDNLIKVMITGLPSTDWVPPLLKYFDRFGHTRLLEFLTLLDNQLSSDWIGQYTPTARIEQMNDVIRAIERAEAVDDVFDEDRWTRDAGFDFDGEEFCRNVDAAVYGRRFTRYILLKLDFLYADHSHRMSVNHLSVEHILPQNPKADSQWRADFTDEERAQWLHRLGNLVLITTRKNTAQGNRDFTDKKANYFRKRVTSCPNSLRVLNQYDTWTPATLEANHDAVLDKLFTHYGFKAVAN